MIVVYTVISVHSLKYCILNDSCFKWFLFSWSSDVSNEKSHTLTMIIWLCHKTQFNPNSSQFKWIKSLVERLFCMQTVQSEITWDFLNQNLINFSHITSTNYISSGWIIYSIEFQCNIRRKKNFISVLLTRFLSLIHSKKYRSFFRTKRRLSIAPLPVLRLNDKEIMANEFESQSMISNQNSITSVNSLASLLKEKMQVSECHIRNQFI